MWGQTTLFLWQSDGSTTAKETVFTCTGGSAAFYGSANPSIESASYNSAVTDNELKATGTKGHKLGTNTLYLKISLNSDLQAGDVIYICGYNPYRVGYSVTSNRADTNIAESLTTGTSKTDYNVGSVTLTAAMITAMGDDLKTIYLSRANGSGTGLAAVKIVRPAPAGPEITTQPQSAAYASGQTIAALTVEATASAGDLAYQWYSCDDAAKTNAVAISGATNASYTPTAAGFYYVEVTDPNGSVESDVAEITISAAEAPTSVTVTGAPDSSINPGAEVTLTATVEGGVPTPTIQWYSNTTASNTGGSIIDGATNNSYSPSTAEIGTFYYYAVATNSEGSVASDVQTITIVGRADCQLLQVVYSNSFDAFIKEPTTESNGTVNAYYLGTTAPTITSYKVSDGATYSFANDKITVTAEDGTTTAVYDVTAEAVSPYETIGSLTFDGEETWVKTGYTFTTERGWRFAKNATTDNRIPEGWTRLYFFVGKAANVRLINGGISSERNIKVYVNGVQVTSITKVPKNSATSNYITIPCSTTEDNMIAIVSDQTGGDGGFTSITVYPENITATIAGSGFTTLSSEFALDFSSVQDDNLDAAYVVSALSADKATFTQVTTAVPAETGLVLQGEKGATVSIPVVLTADPLTTANYLHACVNGGTVASESVYALSGGQFKLYTGTELPAGKAYLLKTDVDAAGGSGAPLSFDFGGDVTGISTIDNGQQTTDNRWYDLSGRRVENPTKGMYIHNGKKVIVK